MKIVMVGPGILPIPPNGYGAVEKHIANLAEYMSKRGHRVTILNKLLGEYAWGIRTGQLLTKMDYDVAHAHTSFMGGYLSRFAPPENLVYTSHSPLWFLPELGPRERWGMQWEKLAVSNSDATVPLTVAHGRLIADFLNSQADVCPVVRVIPNGVDTELYFPRDTFARTGDKVCMVGKVVPRKSVHVVAQAMQAMNAELHIIGPTPDRSYVREIQRMNPKVKFHGTLPERELALTLSEMDIFVNASQAEAMSLSVLEAMSSGLPIVCNHASREQVGDAGLDVMLDDNPVGYRQAIQKLLDDSSFRILLGQIARERVLRLYSWPRIAEQMEGLYLAVLADMSS